MKQFDAIILGAGQAGPPLAGRLTSAGMTVALVERHLFGGTCVNTGCTPTKTMVASAYAAHLARRGADFGVVTGAVSVDMARVRARADAVVGKSRDGRRALVARDARLHRACRVTPASRRPTSSAWATSSCAPHASSSTSGGAPAFRRCRASIACRISTTARCWRSIDCPRTWSSWAAATSGWSSRRCTGASAPR